MINIIVQVKREAAETLILFLNELKTGLNMPVTTVARIIIEIKGHISQPSMMNETINRAKKNLKIMSLVAIFFIVYKVLPLPSIPPDLLEVHCRQCYIIFEKLI